LEFGCGAIVVRNAIEVKFEECFFVQNTGWRTGAINIKNMKHNWISAINQ
jgi:hypothetical protein